MPAVIWLHAHTHIYMRISPFCASWLVRCSRAPTQHKQTAIDDVHPSNFHTHPDAPTACSDTVSQTDSRRRGVGYGQSRVCVCSERHLCHNGLVVTGTAAIGLLVRHDTKVCGCGALAHKDKVLQNTAQHITAQHDATWSATTMPCGQRAQ